MSGMKEKPVNNVTQRPWKNQSLREKPDPNESRKEAKTQAKKKNQTRNACMDTNELVISQDEQKEGLNEDVQEKKRGMGCEVDDGLVGYGWGLRIVGTVVDHRSGLGPKTE